MAEARGARVIASVSKARTRARTLRVDQGLIPALDAKGVAGRVQAAAGGRADAVFDVAGKTPVEEADEPESEPSEASG